MKKIALMLMLFAIGSKFSFLEAQDSLSVTELTPDTLTVCLDTYSFGLKIKNNSSQVATDFSIMVDLPTENLISLK
jgi:hypothetical protein